MSILITGGSGWIGTGLAHRLAARGEDLILFDNAPEPGRVGDLMDKVRIVRGDVKVWPEVMNLVKENGVEGIFHLSGLSSSASDLNPWASYETNVTGSMHVLEAARLFGVKRVVFTSTMGSYGLGIRAGTITDETLQRPTTMYGAGKLYIELLGRYYRRRFGLDFRCLRYPNVFSPRSIIHPKLQYVAWMIQSAALGEPAEIPVTPESKLPPLYYEDALRATEMLYDAPSEAIETVCYNVVGTFPSPTARQVELAIREIVPDAAFTYAPDPWIMNYYGNLNDFDDSCARAEWGWQAAHADLGTVVAAFIQEVRANPDFYRQALERPFLDWPPTGARSAGKGPWPADAGCAADAAGRMVKVSARSAAPRSCTRASRSSTRTPRPPWPSAAAANSVSPESTPTLVRSAGRRTTVARSGSGTNGSGSP